MLINHCIEGEHIPWGTTGYLIKRVSKRSYCRIWACVGDLGKGLRKWGFTLNRIMSGSRGNSMIDHFNKSFVEGGKNRVRLKL